MKYYGKELYHHGIEGQKWGIRRYQNPDGTLTEEGRIRYLKMDPNRIRKNIRKKINIERRKQGQKWYNRGPIGENSEKAIKELKQKQKKLLDDQMAIIEKNNNFLEYKSISETFDKAIEKAIDNGESTVNYKGKKYSFDDFRKLVNDADEKWGNNPEYKKYRKLSDDYLKSYTYNGSKYSKTAIKNIGNINIGYLKDLGYNEEDSKFINSLLEKTDKVSAFSIIRPIF